MEITMIICNTKRLYIPLNFFTIETRVPRQEKNKQTLAASSFHPSTPPNQTHQSDHKKESILGPFSSTINPNCNLSLSSMNYEVATWSNDIYIYIYIYISHLILIHSASKYQDLEMVADPEEKKKKMVLKIRCDRAVNGEAREEL